MPYTCFKDPFFIAGYFHVSTRDCSMPLLRSREKQSNYFRHISQLQWRQQFDECDVYVLRLESFVKLFSCCYDQNLFEWDLHLLSLTYSLKTWVHLRVRVWHLRRYVTFLEIRRYLKLGRSITLLGRIGNMWLGAGEYSRALFYSLFSVWYFCRNVCVYVRGRDMYICLAGRLCVGWQKTLISLSALPVFSAANQTLVSPNLNSRVRAAEDNKLCTCYSDWLHLF